jgi:hypothetical protein
MRFDHFASHLGCALDYAIISVRNHAVCLLDPRESGERGDVAAAGEDCLAAGIDDYIAKPVRLADLASILNQSLQSQPASIPA